MNTDTDTGADTLKKIKEITKIIIGAAFAVLAVIDVSLPVDQQLFTALIDTVFAIVGSLIGGPAAIRFVLGKALVERSRG